MPTYYILEQDGKVIFKNRNSACFAEITSSDYEFSLAKDRIDWSKTKLTFLPNQTLTKDIVKKFLKKVATFGIEAKLVEVTKNEWIDKHPGTGMIRGDKLITLVEIDCSKFYSKKFLKVGIHVLRVLIEDPVLSREYVKCKTPVGLDNFQHLRIIATLYPGAHNYFGNLLYASYQKPGQSIFKGNVPFKNLKDKLEKASWHSATSSICSDYQENLFETHKLNRNTEQDHLKTLITLTRHTAKKAIK